MKNILIISGHPDLQHSLANAEILAEVENPYRKPKSANWMRCIRTVGLILPPNKMRC
ncbi:hypothetical protein [Eikenella longinqua]|uniref:hypothetical protein n=1 Tax=Eikenella longinqua TaxID=1795827 RepID=UPI000AADDD12|nr:hypothetical protein [Eikenella longinqua]